MALKPDVMILNLEAKIAADGAGYGQKLAEVGNPIVQVDIGKVSFAHTPA